MAKGIHPQIPSSSDKLEELFPNIREARLLEKSQFRGKVAEHKKTHPCCINPEMCVAMEESPNTPRRF